MCVCVLTERQIKEETFNSYQMTAGRGGGRGGAAEGERGMREIIIFLYFVHLVVLAEEKWNEKINCHFCL